MDTAVWQGERAARKELMLTPLKPNCALAEQLIEKRLAAPAGEIIDHYCALPIAIGEQLPSWIRSDQSRVPR